MTLTEISSCRLFSQKIASTEFASAKEVVGWMGAMQAQDFAMAKWAVGLRLLYPTNLKIETALNKGEIIRTHLMRPTWHFVASDDIYRNFKLPFIQSENCINRILFSQRSCKMDGSDAGTGFRNGKMGCVCSSFKFNQCKD